MEQHRSCKARSHCSPTIFRSSRKAGELLGWCYDRTRPLDASVSSAHISCRDRGCSGRLLGTGLSKLPVQHRVSNGRHGVLQPSRGQNELVDLLIAWRGEPRWFGDGTRGGGGGTNGLVSQSATYNGVTIAFQADFDAGTVAIGDVTVPLTGVNAILIDQVERANSGPRSNLWIKPDLPLGLDVNLVMAHRSRDFRRFLRCEVPMPAASSRPMRTRSQIVTVCEKLATGRG